eukprot:3980019-Prymnesium_polylepis.1
MSPARPTWVPLAASPKRSIEPILPLPTNQRAQEHWIRQPKYLQSSLSAAGVRTACSPLAAHNWKVQHSQPPGPYPP